MNLPIAFIDKWKDCDRCELKDGRTQVVFGHGNAQARLMMIGEAPGEDEDKGGEPFLGRAGQLFNKILEAVGLERSEIWISNTCLCRPPNNRNPKAKEIYACKARLLEEIGLVEPEIIVITGNIPLFMATRKRGITKNSGWVDSYDLGGYNGKVFATLHPASMLYGSKEQIVKKKHMAFSHWKEIAAALK